MADEEVEFNSGSDSVDMADFLASRVARDQGAQGARGDIAPVDKDEDQAEEAGVTDDTEGDEDTGGQDEKKSAQAGRLSTIVRKLTLKERENQELRRQLKEMETKVQSSGNRTRAGLEDRMAFVRSVVAEALGVDPTDARVQGEVSELGHDIMLELAGEAADRDPVLRERRQQRREQAQKRERDRQLDDRLERLEREKLEGQRTAFRTQAVAQIAPLVTEAEYPFLSAQGEHPAGLVFQVVQEDLKNGDVVIRTDEDGLAAVKNAARRLDDWYRQHAGRFAKALGVSGGQSVEKPRSTPVEKPKKKNGYTTTDRGASGKTGRAVRETREPETLDDFIRSRIPRR